MSITVHYGRDYDNAFWDGTQLVFGDGDGQIFERFTKPMDVMAHEFTHGVTQFTVGLAYQDQPGALNESISDVFASMAKQRMLGQTAAEADWLIAAGLFMPGSMPRRCDRCWNRERRTTIPKLAGICKSGSMADYVETDADSGGVHINSGIPNRAFALAALDIGGYSWEKAGQVWYDTMVNGQLSAQAGFESFAQATVTSARRLFPNEESVAEKIGPRGSRSAYSIQALISPHTRQPALASASPPDRATSLRPSPCAAVVALPAPPRSGSWTSMPIPRARRSDIC